jgi:2-polyprenyl-6-methoxyphenol hydroxylase-like FAD-dependent oxidoreductase
MWRWYTSHTGIIAFLRPDNKGNMRASVNFLSKESSINYLSLDEKKEILSERMQGAGWECDRIAHELKNCDDIFLAPLSQVKAKTWHKDRCVLVGDAAYCPTPYTGMGTTLAIIGAYILAQELIQHNDVNHAFIAYESRFRPFVETAQKLPPGVPNIAYANSKIKVKLFHLAVAIGASKPIQKIISLFNKSEKNNKFKI